MTKGRRKTSAMQRGEPDPLEQLGTRVPRDPAQLPTRYATATCDCALGVMRQHCSWPLRSIGQKARDPSVPSVQRWLTQTRSWRSHLGPVLQPVTVA